MGFSVYIMPVLILALLIYARVKKLETYGTFVKGAKGAFDLVLGIFPFIATIMIMVALLRASGIMDILVSVMAPVFSLFGIPPEVCELELLRPFAGSGSYMLLSDIFQQYGPDSYVSRCASVIMGSSETVFYISTVYFSKTKVKRLGYAIPVSLLATIIGVIFGCFICKII